MEVGKEGRLYTNRYTVTTRMIPALRRAAMRAVLMFSVGSDGQSHKTVSTNHNLFEEIGEPKRYRTEVLPLTSLTSYRWAKPAHIPGGEGKGSYTQRYTVTTTRISALRRAAMWATLMLYDCEGQQNHKAASINVS